MALHVCNHQTHNKKVKGKRTVLVSFLRSSNLNNGYIHKHFIIRRMMLNLPDPDRIELGLRTVEVSKLLLDNQNPRLPPEAISFEQKDLYRMLDDDFELFPIAQSMVDNGYFQEEPLVGIPGPDDKIIVVEGNRRLAALKFLTDHKIRNRSTRRDTWEKLYKEYRKSGADLTRVPIVIHEKREDLRSLLGFRHITGIKKWDALAKARFVNNLIEKKEDVDFYSVGREVGSRQDAIKRSYAAYRTYKQARDDFNIDTSKVENRFGVFYTALNNGDIRKYIGLDMDKSLKKLKYPISRTKADELERFISYLHGNKNVEPVFTDSRNISDLGEILTSPEARKTLNATRNFKLAYMSTGGEERTLIENLESAHINLTEAYKTIYRHCDNKKVEKLVYLCFGTFEQILRSCPRIKEKLSTPD